MLLPLSVYLLISAVALLLCILKPFFSLPSPHSLSLFLSLSLSLSLPFALREKRLLTSSRLLEPFFPQRNSGYDLLFQRVIQCTEE
uniref:Uncharacterized protein n=1 Tax=Pelusios castaneus TaxID=367368 RepID=A0A8C8SJG7_9SAUR